MINHKLYDLMDEFIKKRDAQTRASGFTTVLNSNHICLILKDGHPISYGSNIYLPNKKLNKHAESNALEKFEKIVKRVKPQKRQKIDLFIIRTNKSSSKPCNRCINEMVSYNNRGKMDIRNIYYTSKDYLHGIRNVKFRKLVQEERYYCSYDIHYNSASSNV